MLQGGLIDCPSVLIHLVCASYRNQERKYEVYLTQQMRGVVWVI